MGPASCAWMARGHATAQDTNKFRRQRAIVSGQLSALIGVGFPRRYSVEAHVVVPFQHLNGLFSVRESGSPPRRTSLTPSSGDTTYPVQSIQVTTEEARYELAAEHRSRRRAS